MSDVRHRYLAIVSDLEKMTEADGHEEWRKKANDVKNAFFMFIFTTFFPGIRGTLLRGAREDR